MVKAVPALFAARLARRAGAAVDRGAIRFMERTMRRNGPARMPDDARARLRELAAAYAPAVADEARFFASPPMAEVTETARGSRLGAAEVVDLAYASRYRPYLSRFVDEYASYGANLTAHARMFRAREPRPVAICLHGWGGGAYWLEERAFLVKYLVRIGLDVVLPHLPYHGNRTPASARGSGALFPSPNLVRTNEAFGQAVHDLRALIAWLRARGAPAVGVAGMSLGGYTTSLLATVEDELAFAVPIIPAVDMASLMWRHGRESAQRRRAEAAGVSGELLQDVFRVHAPLHRTPRLDRERMLIVAGHGDRICPPEQAELLWQHWGRPDIHWFPGGHLAQVGRGDAFRAIRRKLARLGLAR